MYRILIVEDIRFLCEQLSKLIAEELPESEVVTAATVEGAQQEISYAREIGLRFDAAILDIYLPRSTGLNPEPDTTLRDLIFKLPWGTHIFRISAFEPPESDREAAEQPSTSTSLQRIEFVPKSGTDWRRHIIIGLKRDRITRQMNEFFLATGRVEYHRSTTYALAELIRDIELFWSDLDENDRNAIRAYFSVREEGADVKAALEGPEREPDNVDPQKPQ